MIQRCDKIEDWQNPKTPKPQNPWGMKINEYIFN